MPGIELKDLVLPLATAAGSMGGFAVVGKWLFKGIVTSIETLPSMMKAVADQGEAIKELFDSRNKHQSALDTIQNTHHMRGCDEPIPARRETDGNPELALKKILDEIRGELYRNRDRREIDHAAAPHLRAEDSKLSEE